MLSPLLLEVLAQSRFQELAIADERRLLVEDPIHHLSAPDGSQMGGMQLTPEPLTGTRSVELLRRNLAATWCKWWIRRHRSRPQGLW